MEKPKEGISPENMELMRKFEELQRKYNEKGLQLAGLVSTAIESEKNRAGRENLYNHEIEEITRKVTESGEYKVVKEEERKAYEEMQNVAGKLGEAGVEI